jgi:flagellar export protein FliJ
MVATDGRHRPGGRAGLLHFMQRFHFTLDSVRDLRDDRQTAAMMVLADRIRTHTRAQQAAEASLRRHRAAEHALAGAGRAAALLVQADRDRDAARLQLEAATVELRDTSFGVDAARGDLVEARQALESVRKLEQRRRAEHRAARAREEERELADVLEARAARAATAARRAAA